MRDLGYHTHEWTQRNERERKRLIAEINAHHLEYPEGANIPMCLSDMWYDIVVLWRATHERGTPCFELGALGWGQREDGKRGSDDAPHLCRLASLV